MADKETEVLSWKLSADPKAAIAAATRFQTEMSKRLKFVEKSEDKVNKGISKFLTKMTSAKRIFGPVLQKQIQMYDATAAAIQRTRQELQTLTGELEREKKLTAELEKQAASANADEVKGIKAKIAESEKAQKLKEKEINEATKKRDNQHEALRKIESVANQAREQIKIDPDLFREAGSELVKPFSAFARRDLVGFLEEGGRIAGQAFKASSQGVRRLAKMDTKDPAMGAMLKGVVGMSKAVRPLIDMVAKFAPMLQLAGGVMMGLLQMFIGAEQAATDFNREVLASSTASGFMRENMGDMAKAVGNAKDFMRDLNKQANSAKNITRGMTKDMVSGALSQLGAEGQDLSRMRKELATISKSTTTAAKDIQDFNDVTWLSVAYSRQFGVSLSEITQLQGEMMTEMGMSLSTVQTQFQNMDRSAEQAGMAANKFFGIVRSFSADLSLFTLRMEDLTKVMMVLGKTMNPRNAQKFLQTVTQQFKGASLMDRTKSVIIGGKSEMKGIAQDDMSRRIAGLGVDISSKVGKDITADLTRVIQGGDTKQIAEFLSQFGDRIEGAQAEAVFDAARMQSKLASNDTVDIASAIKDASPIAAIEMLQQISEKRFGKPLEELKGIQRIAIETMAGINDEQIDQMYKMNAGLIKTQTDLSTKLEAYQKARASGMSTTEARSEAGITQAETGMLQKLGISIDSASAAEEARNKSAMDIWNSLDVSQQELMKEADPTKKFQEQTAGLQQSMLEVMGKIFDFLTTEFYTVVMQIKDAVMGMWDFFGGPSKPIESWKGQTQGTASDSERAQHSALQKSVLGMTPAQREAYNADIKKGGGRGKLSLKEQYDKALQFGGKATAEGKAAFSGAAATKSTAAAAPVEVEDGPTEQSQEKTTSSVDKVNKTLKKGVSLARPTNEYNQASQDSTLGAIRQGLFEYYMYSGMDRTTVAAGLRSGAYTPSNFGSMVAGQVGEAGNPNAVLANLASPNADGGIVASITNGKANVNRLPPGEGWASVGPGERIMPAGSKGGGGGPVKVELELKGDLRRFVDARVVDGAANFERNKRLR